MIRINKLLALAILTGGTLAAIYSFSTRQSVKVMPQTGFALVELFTSEGCSSCPAADELVARILKEDRDKPVYILGYHVDYWNRLGWRDVFSDAKYSARQRQYAAYLHADVYTPQIVLNGKKEFVGSAEGTLRNAIKAGLQQTAVSPLVLSNISFSASALNLHYQAAGTGNRALLIAFVIKSAQSQVKSGENSGHTLNHVNVVRDIQSINLKQASGSRQISLPAGFDAKTWQVIAFIQNTATGEVLAAQTIEDHNS